MARSTFKVLFYLKIELPEIGIYGNTHFLMSDLNNIQIADLLSKWMKEKGLD